MMWAMQEHNLHKVFSTHGTKSLITEPKFKQVWKNVVKLSENELNEEPYCCKYVPTSVVHMSAKLLLISYSSVKNL
jgi:coproporphyrinogen III oxidase-like Fe-S oxidoreductase